MACTAMPVVADQFVVEFQAIVNPGAVHHMSIHACDAPHSSEVVWDCVNPSSVCGGSGKRQALFEWGRNAPTWTLPDYAGIPTGNRPRYLVLQVHTPEGFQPASIEGQYTFSGIEVTMRDSQPAYEVGMAVYGNTGYIPPLVEGYTTDSACVWNHNITAPLIAYSIHTHELGKAVTAWIFRDERWIELARADPSYPEIIMDISHKGMHLIPGDIVAVRCTFNNLQERKVYFSSEHGEMCNVYLHYGVPPDASADKRMVLCSASAQEFRLEDHFNEIPNKASDPTETQTKLLLQNFIT
ncbi:hypothetical protein ScPMuIL_010462 [Solemya velum]